jgi:mannosidase alpha-like ER degradation enhancer 2
MRTARVIGPALGVLLGLVACGGPGSPERAERRSVSPRPPSPELDPARAALAARARAEIAHAWGGYRQRAWGHDELVPIAGGGGGKEWYGTSLLLTAVDALDTLLIAGLTREADEARELVAAKLSFDVDASVQVFEVTIRLLGGLLSAYQMTGDARLLALADDLGRRLLPAFRSPTGMPYRYVHLRTGAVRDPRSNPAEIGTLMLEFGTLGRLTGKEVYYETAKRAVMELARHRSPIGLVGEVIDVKTGRWVQTRSHVGAYIDSYYEYLLKSWRLFGDEDFRRLWTESAAALHRHVIDDQPTGLWYAEVDMTTGERTGTAWGGLQAFLPAVLALSGDLDRARRLQDSSFSLWRRFGAIPDGFDYRSGKVTSPSYPLRPEIVESAFYLRRLTGEQRYIAMGERFLDDLVACCRTEIGYTVLADVTTKKQGDSMPSFFLAETLKYLYLLFADDARVARWTDLDRIVFTTEGHPLRRTW